MDKAMLIMDMPSCCGECPVHSTSVFGAVCCRANRGKICRSEKPTWCPLREVPKKIVSRDSDITRLEKLGYNACIDEILGGAENG